VSGTARGTGGSREHQARFVGSARVCAVCLAVIPVRNFRTPIPPGVELLGLMYVQGERQRNTLHLVHSNRAGVGADDTVDTANAVCHQPCIIINHLPSSFWLTF